MGTQGQFRLFAGHYQFILCDADSDPLREVPRWTKRDTEVGYVASTSAAFVVSKANLNNIVVRVELSHRPPDLIACDRRLSFPMSLPSGVLYITSLDGLNAPYQVAIGPGIYQVYLDSFHLGVDEMTTGELLRPDRKRLTDEERFAREDFEHHRVTLVLICP